MLDKISEMEITSFEGLEYSSYGLLKAVFNTKSHGLVEEHDLFRVALAMVKSRGTDNEKFLKQAWDRTMGSNDSITQYQWQMRGFVEAFRQRFTPDISPYEAVQSAEQTAEKLGIAAPRILGYLN